MIWVEIRCNQCGKAGLGKAGFGAQTLRTQLKQSGWKYFDSGEEDFCPECKTKAEANEKNRTNHGSGDGHPSRLRGNAAAIF